MTENLTLEAPCVTGSGGCAVWCPEAFGHVLDERTWHQEINEHEGLHRNISAGYLVPVGDDRDGGYSITVVVRHEDEGPASDWPVDLVQTRVSEPYLLHTNGRICVSGIEFIGAAPNPNAVHSFDLPAGKHVAVVYAVGDAEKSEEVFIVVLSPWDDEPIDFRTAGHTFDEEPPEPEGQVCVRVTGLEHSHQVVHKLKDALYESFTDVRRALRASDVLFVGNMSHGSTKQRLARLVTVVSSAGGQYEVIVDGSRATEDQVRQLRES